MNNLLKGWITSLLGLAVMVIDALYYFGVISLPSHSAVPTDIQVGIAFLFGVVLFWTKPTWIEAKIEIIVDKVIDKLPWLK